MIKATLMRKISNAANRKDDVTVVMHTTLPAVPGVSHKVQIGFSAAVEIDEVVFAPGSPLVIVKLHADHSSFKANEPAGFFAEQLMSYINTGWELA